MKASLAAALLLVSCALLGPSCGSSAPGPQPGAKLPARQGAVSVMQDFGRRSSSAFFVAYEGALLDRAGCTQESVGDCRIGACRPSAADGGGDSTLKGTTFEAGPITFDFGTTTWMINPKADGVYESKREDIPVWQAGVPISVTAAGGGVPSFSATVLAPDDVAFTAPVYSSAARTVPRNAGLALAWTGGGVGEILANVTLQSSTQVVTVSCSFPSAPGSAVIPAAVLAKFPPGEGFLSAHPASVTEVSAGDWRVSVSATISTHMLFLKLLLE
jgi:hypothetical protein